MAKDLNEIEHELSELRDRLGESFEVLADLIKVQEQFEELAQTYQKIKEDAEDWNSVKSAARTTLERIERTQETIMQRLGELERATNNLEEYKRKAETSLNKLERRTRLLHNLIVVAIVIGFTALVLALLPFFSNKP